MNSKISLLLFLAAFGHIANAQTVAAARDCDSVAGSAAILQPGKVILLGELHGTNESPAMVGDLACDALSRRLSVTVALEIPIVEQPAVDRFIESDGTPQDFDSLIAGDFWQRDYQDGRASVAMARLIRRLRNLRNTFGESLQVLLLDDPESEMGRDRFMADRLKSEMARSPKRLIIALTGNVHNQVATGSHFSDDYEPMGYFLVGMAPERSVISLDLTYSGGSAWVCTSEQECGPMRFRGDDDSERVLYLDDESADPRTGTLSLGTITAALPAKDSGRVD